MSTLGNGEASLYRSIAHYSSAFRWGDIAGEGTVSPQQFARNVTASVDCKTFPDGTTCHECNATGPGTFDCCWLKGMRNPGDSCIILNDPSAKPAVDGSPPLASWLVSVPPHKAVALL